MIDKNWQKVILIVSATITVIGAITLLNWIAGGPSGMAVSASNVSRQTDILFLGGILVFLVILGITAQIYRDIEQS
ncbi:MAG: hypothetical protein QXW00_00235 [Candidatus Woesearchaeota archaeon]